MTANYICLLASLGSCTRSVVLEVLSLLREECWTLQAGLGSSQAETSLAVRPGVNRTLYVSWHKRTLPLDIPLQRQTREDTGRVVAVSFKQSTAHYLALWHLKILLWVS